MKKESRLSMFGAIVVVLMAYMGVYTAMQQLPQLFR